ncbi:MULTISPECIES: hypothetical protein [Klebsiella pneumoniae complex]|uniref:Uncharacterized protein n=2 Tax=Klebsiella pneumoniae complex TaxID=3390273 RepID=A0A8H9ZRJ2_9ENTR|nr:MULTISPECIES: hypothetical protein [Klebsiella]MBC5047113.1 hypothetical protein [Klebsiella quasipneumoniae]MDF3331298.1 hypothetical protein [Klebsiella quasipneumoniae subsp. similipneumoniae]MDW5577018.1 hypothetical protein [Klebsiella pneumoniae]HBZ4191490.1 hypothetical protein [Klebsiella pneumoniae]HBZ4229707.1 hypothetical protein [Klebsiella pneumoniae]
MSLIIVSNDLSEEVHLVTVANGAATATERLSGNSVSAEEMETLFPGFADAITAAQDTAELLGTLGSLNESFIWAQVSGALR